MERINKKIKETTELIRKIEVILELLKTNKKLFKTNKKENSIFHVSKITKFDYDKQANKQYLEYRIYQSYGYEWKVELSLDEPFEHH